MSYVPEEYRDILIFETVDIVGTPDYRTDGFSKLFAQQHLMEYDLLFMLDCGGEWSITQSFDGAMYVDRINHRDRIVYITSEMVKPGGWIVMSKFMEPKFLQEMIRGFEKKKWNVYLDYDKINKQVLSVQRPNLRM